MPLGIKTIKHIGTYFIFDNQEKISLNLYSTNYVRVIKILSCYDYFISIKITITITFSCSLSKRFHRTLIIPSTSSL